MKQAGIERDVPQSNESVPQWQQTFEEVERWPCREVRAEKRPPASFLKDDMRDFTSAHNDYLDPDKHLEPFVEEGPTEADRAESAVYYQQLREIDAAADAQIAELEAEALLDQYDDDPSPYAGNWSEE